MSLFKNTVRQLVLLTALAITPLAALGAQVTEAQPRLSVEEKLKIVINGQSQNIVLKAATDQKPLLNVNLKRTLRLVDTVQEQSDFLKRGINLKQIQTVFRNYKFPIRTISDLVIIKNFANGVKGFSEEQIFKRSMLESDESNFWYAVLPKAAVVNQLLVQREWFSSGVGTHGQLRFILNSPILLVPQDVPVKNSNLIKDLSKADWKKRFVVDSGTTHLIPGDVTYSLYSLRFKGGPTVWSFETGIGGVFANAFTLSSTPHNVVYLAKEDFVEQFEMQNPKTTGTQTFLTALKRADSFKEEKIYHLIFNSCITEMNRALFADGKGYTLKELGITSGDFNPYTFIENLKPLFTAKKIASLNAEFNSPVKNKTVKPEVLKYADVIQSKEFEATLQVLALEALKLSYQDLQNVKSAVAVVKEAFKDGRQPSPAEIKQLLQSKGIKLNASQENMLMTIMSRPDFLEILALLQPNN